MYKGTSWSTPLSRIEHRSAIKIKTLPWCTSSKKVFIFPYVTRLAADKLRVELYKTVKIRENS